jgi:hypothetical protein
VFLVWIVATEKGNGNGKRGANKEVSKLDGW